MISIYLYWIFGENFCLLEDRKNIFLSASRSQFVLGNKTCKNLENRSTDKVFMAKMNLNMDFSIVKIMEGRYLFSRKILKLFFYYFFYYSV